MMKTLSHILYSIFSLALFQVAVAGDTQLCQVGVAKIETTPKYPVRLSGYAVRKTESQGVAQKLWAKAIAIGSDKEGPAVLITADNTGVPAKRNELHALPRTTESRPPGPRRSIADAPPVSSADVDIR